MTNTPTQTLKGFRDFLPKEQIARNKVKASIQNTFQTFGFAPIETPTLEYASLLLGKYGEEADKLVYTFYDKGQRHVGLRYDQTVPSARVLATHQHQLPKYFRRYQIQNVFRADKPQKGRYREFTQCDADIFNSTDTIADAEILALYYQIYADLGITSLQLHVNDRQTLFTTFKSYTSDKVSIFSILQSIDKLDKLKPSAVEKELIHKGLTQKKASSLLSLTQSLKDKPTISENLNTIISQARQLGVPKENIIPSPTLSRGLDYYTGMIFEGIIPEYKVGSVGGGGRYDNLIQELSGTHIPAVGFGLGFDRTVEACLSLGLFGESSSPTQVLMSIFSQDDITDALKTAKLLRDASIKVEVFPDSSTSLGKQFKYANKNNIPFVCIIGSQEIKDGVISLKDMTSGEQITASPTAAIKLINKSS